MTGRVVQVSLGPGGVPNHAVTEARVIAAGLEGDRFRHPNIHGLPHQAVLLVTGEGVEELKSEGYPLFWGALGENLTTQGIDRHSIHPGQRWRVGSQVILEITKRRAPCATLDVYGTTLRDSIFDDRVNKGDTGSPRWGLSGVYARVIEGGLVRPGDPISLAEQDV
jgi:MOSC domain-containing protein YiiM